MCPNALLRVVGRVDKDAFDACCDKTGIRGLEGFEVVAGISRLSVAGDVVRPVAPWCDGAGSPAGRALAARANREGCGRRVDPCPSRAGWASLSSTGSYGRSEEAFGGKWHAVVDQPVKTRQGPQHFLNPCACRQGRGSLRLTLGVGARAVAPRGRDGERAPGDRQSWARLSRRAVHQTQPRLWARVLHLVGKSCQR